MEGSAGFFTGAAATAGYFSRGGGVGVGGDSEFDTKTMDNIITNNNINSNFAVDDLLDFPKEDDAMTDAFFDSFTCGGGGGVGNSGDSSSLTVVDSCNSSVSGADAQFNGSLSCRSFTESQFSGTELCVPYDELAELEWLSTFVEESFSSDELQNLQIISPSTNSKTIPAAVTAITDTSSSATTNTTATVTNSSSISSHIFSKDVLVPGKARSKRSRAAPCDWSSRLLHLSSPANSSSDTNNNNSSSSSTVPEHHPLINGQSKAPKSTNSKRREANTETPGRKCLHCASDKTPQWRTGPMGPKTLCNACGVRYKSGRLVPEYRPAASPTFVSARHSNSHRKVLELRRQKEMQRQQHQQQHLMNQASIFGVSNGGDEFLIHHHHHHPHQQNVGTDYRLMI